MGTRNHSNSSDISATQCTPIDIELQSINQSLSQAITSFSTLKASHNVVHNDVSRKAQSFTTVVIVIILSLHRK